MRLKKMIGVMLAVCFILSLFSTITVGAATEIKSVVLTGDITPKPGQTMKFATSENNPNYTVVQGWTTEKGKTFTDNEEYNKMLGTEFLLPEERTFADKQDYYFQVALIANSADVSFASNVTVSVGTLGEMQKVSEEGSGMIGLRLCFGLDGDHIHTADESYENDMEYHWKVCTSHNDHTFEFTKDEHDFDDADVCRICGYILPEGETTIISQTTGPVKINCGGTAEFSVEATGNNLKYCWFTHNGCKINNSDNYLNTGSMVSGGYTETLKIENINSKTEKYFPIYCVVTGLRGKEETQKIEIEVKHNTDVAIPIDGSGHETQCSCGKHMTTIEEHSYNSGNLCDVCGYEKGSLRTKFKQATLELPDYSDKDTVKRASESATLTGVGIKSGGTGISKILFLNYGDVISDNTMFGKGKAYSVRIYPDLEDNFYMETTENLLMCITYNGTVKRSYAYTDDDGKCYLKIGLGKPYVRNVATFSANGGSGKQNDLYADEQGNIYFPECRFYKTDDEFYAWEYNGKMYSQDPNQYEPVHIEEEYAKVKAVWKSQLTDKVTVNMDFPKHGDKISDVGFYAPQFASYSISGVTWYEDAYQDITKDELGLKLSGNDMLDKSKNYNVRIAVNGNGFASDDKLNVSLNNRSMEEISRNGLQTISFVLHIKGGTNITLSEPTDGIALASLSDIGINNNTVSVDSTKTYWSRNDNESGKYIESSVIAELGTQYYLSCWLSYAAEAKNTILFGNTVLINGKECTVKKIGEDYIRVVVPFTCKAPSVNISEKNGIIYIESPKTMNVTFAIALYDNNMKLKELILKEETALTAGSNEVNLLNVDFSKAVQMIFRDSGESVKVMVFEGTDTLRPLGGAYYYKYRQSKY